MKVMHHSEYSKKEKQSAFDKVPYSLHNFKLNKAKENSKTGA